jgi:hypothetical protein
VEFADNGETSTSPDATELHQPNTNALDPLEDAMRIHGQPG